MKEASLVGEMKSGKILMVGKFLMMKKEVVPYRDKKTGQPATFNKVEFQVFGHEGTVFVQPDTRKIANFNMEAFKSPFKSMQDVVVIIESMEVKLGITTISGTVEPLEA